MKRSTFVGQEVKGQSHKRPKIDLEAWRRHHFRPLGRVAYLEYLSRDRLGDLDMAAKSAVPTYTQFYIVTMGLTCLVFDIMTRGRTTDGRRSDICNYRWPLW